MSDMKKGILGILAVCLYSGLMAQAAPNTPDDRYYGKHVIIAIDQTPDVQNHVQRDVIKKWLNALLMGEPIESSSYDRQSIPAEFTFYPHRDKISLFAFAVEGCSGKIGTPYQDVVYSSRAKCVDVFSDALLAQRKSYDGLNPDMELSQYLNTVVMPMLDGKDPKAESIKRNSGVTMSYYVFPTILNRIDVSIPAEKYYLIMITNFKSGSADGVNTEDERNLLGMLNGGRAELFKEMKAALEMDYSRSEYAKYLPISAQSSVKTDSQRPQISIFQLQSRKATFDNSEKADIESNLDLHQKEWNRPAFELGKVEIKLSDMNIRTIVMDVKNEYGKLLHHKFLASTPEDCEAMYQNKRYIFNPMQLDFPDLKKTGDILEFDYVFYPIISLTDKLPLVYTATRRVSISENNFAPSPIDEDTLMGRIIRYGVAALMLALIVFIITKIRKNRGLKRKAVLDFRVIPVSNSRFMEVKDNRVVNEDCWYMGDDNQNQKISIVGKFDVEEKSFSKKYDYRVEYRVEDADSEDDFTFRPDGIDGQGELLDKNQWYRLDVKPDGKFKLNILTYLHTDHNPELRNKESLRKFFADLEHPYRILKMHIKFRILVMDRKTYGLYKESFQLPNSDSPDDLCKKIFPSLGERDMRYEQIYNFIVKPQFERNTGWVAFDPGTTGSCSAFAISGNPFDPNVVTLAKHQFTQTGSTDKLITGIFPSVIKINDRARCFKADAVEVTGVEEWKIGPDDDYIFGLSAEQRLGNNRFKSVKKLLGYTNLLEIKTDKGVTRKISGKDLALMIVKGLYQNVSEYAMDSSEVDESVRKDMSGKDGRFAPIRAIVAVPNNYTLLKIQDMVDSVKRLGCFEEVHYLYESEGVMMTYLHKMWSSLSEADNRKVFVVYDMGGATINATAFSLDIVFDPHTKNITKITVHTIAKVGYCVGGDDIDYALIRILYDIPSVSAAFGDSDEQKVKNMNENKQKLIQFVTTLKLDLIDKARQISLDRLRMLANDEMFFNEVCSLMGACGVALDSNLFTDQDKKFIKSQLENQKRAKSIMTKYVYSKVEDAVGELIADLGSGDIELIFSGRSSLYNHIQEIVQAKMESCGYKPHVWDGFNDADGYLDADKVKTAVAEGACWFALFNTIIRLDHSVITSSFGYIDQEGGKGKFVPVVKRLEKFKDGKMTHKVIPIDENLKDVKFVQMLGADYDQILHDFYHTKNNRHKINIIDEVRSMSVNGKIENISITIEDNNNFTYDVETSANHITPKTNSYSRLVGHAGSIVKTEIIDENNESYVFAALQSVDEKFEGGGSTRKSSSSSSTRTNRASRRSELMEGMGSTSLPMSTDEPVGAPEPPTKKGRF